MRLKLLLFWGILAAFWSGPGSALAGTPLYPCDTERLGFGVLRGIQNYDVTPLRAGWYVNWGAAAQATHPAGMDFAQMIRTSDAGYTPNGNALANVLRQTPGSLWLIGNEPDCPYQDNTLPTNYARIYHDAYQFIKAIDPQAQVAIGGIVQATPLRMQWLDLVWNEYQTRYGQIMPVDVWNVHAFVLPEVRLNHGTECQASEWGSGIPPGVTANCGQRIEIGDLDRMDLFAQQIVRFRTWMRDHGQQNKPLVVSEYGILFNEELGYDYQRVSNYLLATFNYFMQTTDSGIGYPADGYRLVQRWAWYSLDDTSFGWGTTHSALMDPTTRVLLPLGQDFGRYASRQSCPAYVDVQPFRLAVTTPTSIPYGQLGTVRLALEVRNQGNAASGPSQVRFWDGDPDAGGALLGTVAVAALPSRYQGTITATLDWPVVAAGSHLITLQVDALNQVSESREDNNRLAVTVDFGTINLTLGPASWQMLSGPLRAGDVTQLMLGSAAVTMTQPTAPVAGVSIVPPSFQATWYDGDPSAGGQVIVSRTITAPVAFGRAQPVPAQPWAPVITPMWMTWLPVAFGQAQTGATDSVAAPAGQLGAAIDQAQVVPAQPWAPVITGARSAWLEIGLANAALETTLSDNRVVVTIPATTDLTLTQVQQVRIPLLPEGGTAKIALRFRVRNLGTRAPVIPLEVGLWQGTTPSGAPLGHVPLAVSGDWTEPFTWANLPAGAYPFVGWVNPDGVIQESVTTNNQLAGTALVAKSRHYWPLILRR